MSRMGCLCMLLLLGVVPLAHTAELRPGDQVRFIEREQHIPAHPAPGDTRVSLRLVSGSQATVLAIHAATGWIEVQGEPVQGTVNTGWITPTLSRQCARHGGADGGHPGLVSAQRLPRAASQWPAAARHLEPGEPPRPGWPIDLSGPDPSVKRTAVDYDRMRCYVRLFDPDILAVQEVDGEAALSRVVDTDVYDVHVDDRPKGSLNGQQNTGFAVKRGLTVVRQPDFQALDIRGDGSLRYGTRIDLTHNGQTIQLMSVHLKSGCFENPSTSSDCETLLAQVPVLEGWIDAAAAGAEAVHRAGGLQPPVQSAGRPGLGRPR